MPVTRAEAITGEQLILTITFREDNTGKVFDPFSIEQVDILRADGQTVLETIPSGSITKTALGIYEITTTQAISQAGLIQDRWLYRLKDGGAIKTSIEVTNVSTAPSQAAAVESQDALPRDSAVVLRPLLLTFEFRDDQTGELLDPYEVRQVEILEEDGSTLIQQIAAINRIGTGKYRVQADAITTPRTILDKWYFTVAAGEEERVHLQDTQVYDQSALGGVSIEEVSVPEVLYSDVGLHDAEVVLVDSVEKIGVTFKDVNGIPVNPAQLSLCITTPDGGGVLGDVYLPTVDRLPNPPRIINPSAGRFEFPLGLDNGETAPLKKNKTRNRCDLLFTWRASSIAGIQAATTIDPGVNPNSSIVWTSVAEGTPGEFINIAYIDPGASDAPLSVVRDGSNIVVNLATNAVSAIITTAADIIAEVISNEEVSEILTVALPMAETGLGVVGAVSATFLTGGVDASEELVVCQNVRVITTRICSLLQKLRLQIDKSLKLVSSDPEHPCYLGYTEGQLVTYLEHGLQIINAYQPSGVFSLDNYPYTAYEFTLIEASLLAGVMSQELFAIDTDIPNWSDQGNTFVIQHQPQLAQYLTWLSQRLDKMIPMLKLNFVSSGSLHIEAGPNFRLAQLIDAAPSGALFRNVFFKG
jgi:hypothetical protein